MHTTLDLTLPFSSLSKLFIKTLTTYQLRCLLQSNHNPLSSSLMQPSLSFLLTSAQPPYQRWLTKSYYREFYIMVNHSWHSHGSWREKAGISQSTQWKCGYGIQIKTMPLLPLTGAKTEGSHRCKTAGFRLQVKSSTYIKHSHQGPVLLIAREVHSILQSEFI